MADMTSSYVNVSINTASKIHSSFTGTLTNKLRPAARLHQLPYLPLVGGAEAVVARGFLPEPWTPSVCSSQQPSRRRASARADFSSWISSSCSCSFCSRWETRSSMSMLLLADTVSSGQEGVGFISGFISRRRWSVVNNMECQLKTSWC